MRKRKSILVVSALAVAVGATGIAWAFLPSDQQVIGKVTPIKHPKVRYTNAKLKITTNAETGDRVPPGASRARVSFDDDLKFNANAAAKCDPNAIDGQPTAQARVTCKRALVGIGDATAYLGVAGEPKTAAVAFPVKVSAFNGLPSGGKPTLLLHSDPGFTSPVTLLGKLVNSPKGGDYGKMLDVPVPSAGFILAAFTVTVGKVVNPTLASAKVVPGPYVKARCHDRNHRLNYFGLFDYSETGNPPNDYAATDTGQSKSKCAVKRVRR